MPSTRPATERPAEIVTASEVLDGYARVERFDVVGSTNVTRSGAGWPRARPRSAWPSPTSRRPAGVATAARGRPRRERPSLLSLGFRPTWLDLEESWRLAGVVALAIADAAEEAAGLEAGTIRLKWPNDLVALVGGPTANAARDGDPREIRKIAGILGETDGLGTPDPRVIIGAGINVDWAAADFPPDLAATMSSLREVAGGRPISRDDLLDGFLGRLRGADRVAPRRAVRHGRLGRAR